MCSPWEARVPVNIERGKQTETNTAVRELREHLFPKIQHMLKGLMIRYVFRLLPLSGTGTLSATQNLHS
jgi:hypothetical protein